MRRFAVGALLFLFLGQSSGVALAGTQGGSLAPLNLAALITPVQSAVRSSRLYAALTGTTNRYEAMHAPAPMIRPLETTLDAARLMRSHHALRPRIREGVQRTVIMPDRSALDPRHRRLDPLAMRRSTVTPSTIRANPAAPVANVPVLQPLRVLAAPPGPHGGKALSPRQGGGVSQTTASGGGTGIEPWWRYQQRAIPGIGKAMVNVGTGNFIVSAMDVDIPEQGIDLTFQRVYNSQSLHDANGDDGGDPSIFGNRWTNNLDASIIYNSNANTITVYDLSGAACTYTSNGSGGWVPCAGEWGTLAPTDGTDCTYGWTKPNGTVYWFHSDGGPGLGCNIAAAKKGQIQEIFARNQNNNITFAYSYTGSTKTSESITQIVVNHSDGDSLTMQFGLVPGTAINELATITRPDGATLQYSYDTSGNLLEVDKPGNNSAGSIPNNPNPNITVPPGDVPETYAYASGGSTMEEACGPRCTVAMWNHPNNPTDGGALLFAANASNQLTNWQFQGVLNFTPPDGTSTPLQANPSTGFVTWYTASFVYGVGSACSNASSGTTTMCDTDGHGSVWTTDSSDRVTQTQDWAGTAEGTWLVTSQTWDNSNDLTSTTDANGNTTKYGYDTGGYNAGNMVEMQLPQSSDFTVGGQNATLSPLSYYSYDQYHNVIAYCDPVYNQGKGNAWVPSPADNLCPGGTKTTSLTYQQTASEPFGCLTVITKPSTYATNLTYSGGSDACGVGLPNQAEAAQQITQYDGSTRTPTQDFGYDNNGNLTSYDRGTQNGNTLDSWTLAYNKNNLLGQRTENDPIIPLSGSSFSCYYLDGSIFYTETPSQHDTDGDPTCPSTTTLLSGNVTPPAKASAYYYDTDGDQVKMIAHKGCSSNNACPGPTAKTACSSGESNLIGTTCKYYDGLDRLVETIEPYDTRSYPVSGGWPFEFYSARWMDRYIYDLSGNGGSANLHISDSTGTISGIVAYGNLYKTEEWLPQPQNMLAKFSNGQYTTGFQWNDVRGTSFDGRDRPVSKYELAYGTAAVTTNTWDSTGDLGNLGSMKNALSQVTSYVHDNIERVKNVNFSGPAPQADPRSYTFDPDGRTATVSNSMGTLSYAYDVDGNELSVTEPSNLTAYSASLICYQYYPDGLREYVSIGPASVNNCNGIQQNKNPSNGGISQPNIFSYSYERDARLASQQVNWVGLQETFKWTYAPSGRELTEADPLNGTSVTVPPNNTQTTLGKTTYQYDGYGRVSELTLPEGYQETSFIYDVDDETAGVTEAGRARQLTLDARGEIIEDSAGLLQTAQAATYMANGTQVGNGDGDIGGNPYTAPPQTEQFDVRSGMVTAAPDPGPSYSGTGADVYTYDGAGRRIKTDYWAQWPNGTGTNSGSTQYDSENHIETTESNGSVTGSIQWGPDGRHRVETNYNSPTTLNYAHWDGDAILFAATNQQGYGPGAPVLYIGRLGVMDSSGDITIMDRDHTGAQQTTHGSAAFGGAWYEGWSMGSLRTIQLYNPKAGGRMLDIQLAQGSCDFYLSYSPYTYYPCLVGVGPIFAMKRTDGYAMYGGIVQGARTFDASTGQWLTPDPYAGDVKNPMSQKPFVWNNNNPVNYTDPTGYEALIDIQPNALPAYLGHIQIIIYDPATNQGTLLSVQSSNGQPFAPMTVIEQHISDVRSLTTSGNVYYHIATQTWQNTAIKAIYDQQALEASQGAQYNVVTNNCVTTLQIGLDVAGTGINLLPIPSANQATLPSQGATKVDPAALPPPSSTSNIDPLTGLNITFEQNAQQAEDFQHEGEEVIY